MTKAGRLSCNANSSVDLFQRRSWMQKRLCLLRAPDFQFIVSCLIESFRFGVFLQRTWVLETWSFIETCFAQERGSCGITGGIQARVYVQGTPPASAGMRLPGGARLRSASRGAQSSRGRIGTSAATAFSLFPRAPPCTAPGGEAGTGGGRQRAAQDLCRGASASSSGRAGKSVLRLSWWTSSWQLKLCHSFFPF